MNIAIDATRAIVPRWGGIENYTYYLIHALARTHGAHQLTLLTQTCQESRPLPQGLGIVRKEIRPPRLWTQLGLSRETLNPSYDVLLLSGQNVPLLYNWRLPTVVVFHDLSPTLNPEQYRFPGILYLRLFSFLAAKLATHIIAVSEATKNDLIRFYHVRPDKVTVIPEGFDGKVFYQRSQDEVKAVREKYGIGEDYVLFIGTVQPRKNISRLIEAFAQVKQEVTSSLELVVAGKPGWKNEEIYAAPSRLRIKESVRFLDHVGDEDLPALISGAKMLAYPSLFEGFGLVILEAQACGVPVLTSNLSSMPEAAGEAAVLVDPYEVEDIARGMKRLLTDPELVKELVGKGRENVRDFTWEKAALSTLSVLEKVGRRR